MACNIFVTIVATLGAVAWSGRSTAQGTCDRVCLNGLVDTYIAALAARDPSRLPVLAGVKVTENTNPVGLGDGIWQTVDKVGPYRLAVSDPSTGQAMLYTTAVENGLPTLLGVRIKEQNGKIAEIEQFVVRKAMHISGDYDNLKEVESVWSEPLRSSERVSRAELIKAANSYFDGIEQGNGNIVPFDAQCTRILNGRPSTPKLVEEMNNQRFNYIKHVTDRRFLVVDEQRGIVSGTFMFQHPGNITIPASALKDPQSQSDPNAVSLSGFPNTTEIIEAFKIRNGKLYRIFGYISLLPYHQKPGW
jgi:hypothetical protein